MNKEIKDINQFQEKRRESSEFPKDPEERLEALLASFNIGPKAATLLLLPPSPDSYLPIPDLTESFRNEVVVGTEMKDVHHTTAFAYCHKTLCPIGLVARKYTIDFFGKGVLVGFRLTKAGRVYGVPGACLTLYFEKKHHFSLYPVLGPTHTPFPESKRAPFLRAKILEVLHEQAYPIRQVDLIRKFGAHQSRTVIEFALQALKDAGVITYEAVTPCTGRTQVSYDLGKVPLDKIEPAGMHKTLTLEVARACQKLAQEEKLISQATVFDQIPEDLKGKWKESVLRKQINRILPDLARQRFLGRGKFKGAERQSLAQIIERGRVIGEDFLRPLWGLVSDDSQTREWLENEVVPEVLGNFSDYTQNSVELYYPHSHGFKTRESLLTRGRVEALVLQNPGITAPDIRELTRMSGGRIENCLIQLKLLGRIKSEKIKGVSHFYPKNTA
jgi:hypothetical protein